MPEIFADVNKKVADLEPWDLSPIVLALHSWHAIGFRTSRSFQGRRVDFGWC